MTTYDDDYGAEYRRWEEREQMLTRVLTLYRGGSVRRCHTMRTLAPYTVAQHVFGAQLIALELCRLNDVPALPVMLALLHHDAPEEYTGDIPAPFKRTLSVAARAELQAAEATYLQTLGVATPPLTAIERGIVRAADLLDLGLYCAHEHELGNQTSELREVYENSITYLSDEELALAGVLSIIHLIKEVWNYGHDRVAKG